MNERLSESDLLRRLAELPREIQPGKDPWPTISARISGEPAERENAVSRSAWAGRAVAAAVAVAVLTGVWLGSVRESSRPPAQPVVAAAETTPEPAAVSTLAGVVAASEAEYQAAFREFIPVGDYSRERLQPQTLENIEKGWADMRSTEAALNAALEENPNNRFLNDRMLELRARQLGFLQQLASLDLANRRMNS